MRVIDVLFRYLKAEGIDCVFGVPGGLLYPFFDAVEKNPALKLIVTRHEQGAAFMADGYARASGKMAVCAGVSGPGTTNLMTGVGVAFSDGIPMLVITGQALSSTMGKGAAQETAPEDIDTVGMLAKMTKYSVMLHHPDRVGHHLRRALRLAQTGRPGPVHLNVPVDLWLKTVQRPEDWYEPSTYRPRSRPVDLDAVEQAAAVLREACYPVILAGAAIGAAEAREELLNLAELVQARVATTPAGKGVFPEDHPLSMGVAGTGGHRAARDTLLGSKVDVLLAAGTSLGETVTFVFSPALKPPGRRLIQLDIDPDRIARSYPVDVGLVGDCKVALREMHGRLRADRAERASRWPAESPIDHGPSFYLNAQARESRQVPLAPESWRAELQAALPGDAVVFSDIGGCGNRPIVNAQNGSS